MRFAVGCANTDTTNGTATGADPDVVNIAAGTYAEHLAVDAHVNLVGASGAVIDGTDSRQNHHGGLGLYHRDHECDADEGQGRERRRGALVVPAGSTVEHREQRAVQQPGGRVQRRAISNEGVLTISDSTISDNFASFGGGGALNRGTLTITGSTFTGNGAAFPAVRSRHRNADRQQEFVLGKSDQSLFVWPTGGAVLDNVGGTATITEQHDRREQPEPDTHWRGVGVGSNRQQSVLHRNRTPPRHDHREEHDQRGR